MSYGPDLITNGDFVSDFTDWFPSLPYAYWNASPLKAGFVVAGHAKLKANGVWTSVMYQGMSAIEGNIYELDIDYFTYNNFLRARLGGYADDWNFGSSNLNANAVGELIAGGGTNAFYIYISGQPNTYAGIDNIILRAVLPDLGVNRSLVNRAPLRSLVQ